MPAANDRYALPYDDPNTAYAERQVEIDRHLSELDGRRPAAVTPVPVEPGTTDQAVLMTALEDFGGGELVNIVGDFTVRKAIATSEDSLADAFVRDGFAAGTLGLVYYKGFNPVAISEDDSDLDGGSVFLSALVPGTVRMDPPENTATGVVIQRVGTSYGVGAVDFELSTTVQLAAVGL